MQYAGGGAVAFGSRKLTMLCHAPRAADAQLMMRSGGQPHMSMWTALEPGWRSTFLRSRLPAVQNGAERRAGAARARGGGVSCEQARIKATRGPTGRAAARGSTYCVRSFWHAGHSCLWANHWWASSTPAPRAVDAAVDIVEVLA